MKPHCRCGYPSMHTTFRWWEDPSTTYQCCACYVKAGNPPADWHPVCMSTYALVDLLAETLR